MKIRESQWNLGAPLLPGAGVARADSADHLSKLEHKKRMEEDQHDRKMAPCALIGEAAIYADTKPNKHGFPLARCACSCSDPPVQYGRASLDRTPDTGAYAVLGGRA